MLRLDNITLDIQDGSSTRRLLNNVNASIDDGEVVGLTGPSGSGKSTLLAVTAGLQTPTSGTAILSTRDGNSYDLINGGAKVRRQHIGIVFQQPNLLPSLSAQEQLMAMTRLEHPLGISRQMWSDRVHWASFLMNRVGLPGKQDARVNELSGGQQARVNLARALMNNPDLLLIDEPTAALDTENATAVTSLIAEIAHEQRIPVLYVSHDQEQLSRVDRVITMVDGRV